MSREEGLERHGVVEGEQGLQGVARSVVGLEPGGGALPDVASLVRGQRQSGLDDTAAHASLVAAACLCSRTKPGAEARPAIWLRSISGLRDLRARVWCLDRLSA